MVHVVFPDEHYNKHKLITTRRDEFETLHMLIIHVKIKQLKYVSGNART